jgi:hypothetical protein
MSFLAFEKRGVTFELVHKAYKPVHEKYGKTKDILY